MVGLLRRHARRQHDQALRPAALEYASDLNMRLAVRCRARAPGGRAQRHGRRVMAVNGVVFEHQS